MPMGIPNIRDISCEKNLSKTTVRMVLSMVVKELSKESSHRTMDVGMMERRRANRIIRIVLLIFLPSLFEVIASTQEVKFLKGETKIALMVSKR